MLADEVIGMLNAIQLGELKQIVVFYYEISHQEIFVYSLGPVSFWICGYSDSFRKCLPEGKIHIGVQ